MVAVPSDYWLVGLLLAHLGKFVFDRTRVNPTAPSPTQGVSPYFIQALGTGQ